MRIQIINSSKDWENYLDQCSFYTYFHTWNWRNIISNSYGFKPMFVIIDDNFIFPSFKVTKLLGKELISSPLAEYGGPIPFSPRHVSLDEILYIIRAIGKEMNCNIQASMHPFLLNELTCDEGTSQYKVNLDLATYLLKLNDNYADTLKGFSKEVRYDIRKARACNLIFEEMKTQDILDKHMLRELFDIHLHTSRRNQALPFSIKFLNYLFKDENCHVYTVRLSDGYIISFGVFLEYRNIFQYYINSTYNQFFKLRPVYFLISEVIKNLPNSGIEYLDFGGVRKGDSLEIFKKNWGAKQFDILRYSNDINTFDITHLSPFRALWGNMPLFVIKHLSPLVNKYII